MFNRFDEVGNPRITLLGPTAGEAWFANGYSRVPSYTVLASELMAPGNELYKVLKEKVWLIDGDSDVESVESTSLKWRGIKPRNHTGNFGVTTA